MSISLFLLAAVAATPEAAVPDAEADKPVCKRMQMTTSRMGSTRKICMTQAQWDERTRLINKAAGNVKVSGPSRTTGGVTGEGKLARPHTFPTPPEYN